MRMYYVDLSPRSKQFHLNPLDHPSWILKFFPPRSRVAHHPNCCPMSVKLYSTQRARIFADTVAVKILKKTRFKIPTPCAFQHNSFQAIKPCWVEQPEDYLHNTCDSSPPPQMDFTSSHPLAELRFKHIVERVGQSHHTITVTTETYAHLHPPLAHLFFRTPLSN